MPPQASRQNPGVGGGSHPPGTESGVFSSPSDAGDPSSASSSHSPESLAVQLEQKERDLVLAAELGKALLDKNEELSRQNERIAEEFSQKLEVRLTHLRFTMFFYYFFLQNLLESDVSARQDCATISWLYIGKYTT